MTDLAGLEEDLRRIPGVVGARAVADDGGRIVEVHVLASLNKHPKQIVRDVQSVAKAGWHVDIDRRIVSVVQLDGPVVAGEGGDVEVGDADVDDDGAEAPRPRVVVDGVSLIRSGTRATAEVRLGRQGVQALGKADGAAT